MKRYIYGTAGGLGSAALVVLLFTLAIPSDALGYIRRGDKTEIPDGCGVKLRDAIQSVYPGAPIDDTKKWYCRRTLEEGEPDPLGAHCYGEYELTLSGEDWHAKTARDGMHAWPKIGWDEDADTVRVLRQTPGATLDAAQRTAHAQLLTDCIEDDEGDALTWGAMVDVTFSRDEEGAVVVQPNYLASEPKGSTIARLQGEGKVSHTVAEE